MNFNYIFDLDDTLVKRDTVIPLPWRIEMLETIKKNKNRIYIATNQSGPAWRRELLEDKKDTYEKYPTLGEMVRKFEDIASIWPVDGIYAAMVPGDKIIAERVRGRLKNPDRIADLYPTNIFMSFRLDWRKPGGGMLEFICSSNGIEKSNCLFVGDLPTDEQAARNAGIAFQRADEFFV
jgi:FMN phosphatase YigB (HAD superfamily)